MSYHGAVPNKYEQLVVTDVTIDSDSRKEPQETRKRGIKAPDVNITTGLGTKVKRRPRTGMVKLSPPSGISSMASQYKIDKKISNNGSYNNFALKIDS